jgi:hypothetical protein
MSGSSIERLKSIEGLKEKKNAAFFSNIHWYFGFGTARYSEDHR